MSEAELDFTVETTRTGVRIHVWTMGKASMNIRVEQRPIGSVGLTIAATELLHRKLGEAIALGRGQLA